MTSALHRVFNSENMLWVTVFASSLFLTLKPWTHFSPHQIWFHLELGPPQPSPWCTCTLDLVLRSWPWQRVPVQPCTKCPGCLDRSNTTPTAALAKAPPTPLEGVATPGPSGVVPVPATTPALRSTATARMACRTTLCMVDRRRCPSRRRLGLGLTPQRLLALPPTSATLSTALAKDCSIRGWTQCLVGHLISHSGCNLQCTYSHHLAKHSMYSRTGLPSIPSWILRNARFGRWYAFFVIFAAANSYTLPKMIGSTIQSNKNQAPVYSMTGRSKIGSFHEDLQKVNSKKSPLLYMQCTT